MPAPAYTLHGARPDGSDLTFCNDCAFPATAVGLLLSGVGIPKDMDEAIAMTYLAQVERGMPLSAPVAIYASGVCMNCDKAFGHQPSDAA